MKHTRISIRIFQKFKHTIHLFIINNILFLKNPIIIISDVNIVSKKTGVFLEFSFIKTNQQITNNTFPSLFQKMNKLRNC